MRGHLAADDSTHVPHQPLGLTQIAFLDGLDDDQEKIMDLIVEILRPNLAAEIEADSLRKHAVEILQSRGLSAPNSFHEFSPGCIPWVDQFRIWLGFGID